MVVGVLVVTLWDAVPHGNLAGWSAAVIGLSIVRWVVQRSYFRRPARLAQDRWLALFVVLMIPHALMFGLIVWAIFPINDIPAFVRSASISACKRAASLPIRS